MVSEARTAGQTVLLSSHVLSEIQQTADDVAVLAAGRLVAEGNVASSALTIWMLNVPAKLELKGGYLVGAAQPLTLLVGVSTVASHGRRESRHAGFGLGRGSGLCGRSHDCTSVA